MKALMNCLQQNLVKEVLKEKFAQNPWMDLFMRESIMMVKITSNYA